MVVGYAVSLLDDQVAIAARPKVTIDSDWLERFLIVDQSGENITIIESPDALDGNFELVFDSSNGILLLGTSDTQVRGSAYLLTVNRQFEKIQFPETGLSPFSTTGFFTVANNLMGISRWRAFGGSDTVLLWHEAGKKWSYVDAVSLSGPLDTHNSQVLISNRVAGEGEMPFFPSTSSPALNHILVRVDANQAVVESEIRWYGSNSQSKFTNGVITSDHLILSAKGQVVQIPIANLTHSYFIRSCP